MMKSNRSTLVYLCIILFTVAGSWASADAKASFYYSVSLGGYSSGLFSDAEYSDLSLSVRTPGTGNMKPALTAHWLVPVNPLSIGDSLAGLSCDLTLFHLKRHPFSRLSMRNTTLAPMTGIAVFVPVADPGEVHFAVSFYPVRLFSGDMYFSAGAFSIVLDKSLSFEGWGMKLFEISYFLF